MGDERQVLETVGRRGYRFIARVQTHWC
jgi:DNA-binding winged helix-turn-helix (wHTH) protein